MKKNNENYRVWYRTNTEVCEIKGFETIEDVKEFIGKMFMICDEFAVHQLIKGKWTTIRNIKVKMEY